MRKLYSILLIILSAHYAYTQIPVTNLNLWLRADSVDVINDSVITWYDLSGNYYDATQISSVNRPVVTTDSMLNGLPTLVFNGTNSYLETSFGQDFLQPNTYFIVWNIIGSAGAFQVPYIGITAGKTNATLWRNNNTININGGTYVNNIYTKVIPFKFIITTTEFNGPLTNVYENGILMNTVNGGNNAVDALSIGGLSGQSYWLNGNISELILYDSLLSAAERQGVEDYLINRYAPPVDLGADIIIPYGFCDTTITTAEELFYTDYIWSTGETSPTIVVSSTGTYSVTVTNIFGRTSVDEINIEYPVINILSDTILCYGDSILWDTDLSDGYGYNWSTTNTDTAIFINSAGLYWVTVTDTLGLGCSIISDTLTLSIDTFSLNSALDDTLNICDGTYFGLSSNLPSIISYNWNTGSTDSICQVSGGGTYSVILGNTNTCQVFDTTYINIIGIAPLVDFSFDTVCVGSPTSFTDMSLPSGGIVSWYWEFGDSNISFLQNPTHTYLDCDTFAVSLTVNTSICTNKYSKQVYTKPIPTSLFTTLWDIDTFCVNTDISFSNYSFADSLQTFICEWDFGNSGYLTDCTPTYQYGSIGEYAVELTVTQSNGCTDTSSLNITIGNNLATVQNHSLIVPQNNMVFSIYDQVMFSWNHAKNAVYYNVLFASDPGCNNIIQTVDSLTSNSFLTGMLSFNDTVYWKVVAYDACETSYESNSRLFSIYDASTVNNLKTWYTADSVTLVNSKISIWHDISGNVLNATQTNSASRPVIITESVVNYLPVVQFNGTDNYLETLFGQDCDQPNTFILVWKVVNPSNVFQVPYTGVNIGKTNATFWRNAGFICVNGGEYVNNVYPKAAPFEYIITTTEFNGQTTEIYENGILKNIFNGGNEALDGLSIGGANGYDYWLDGNIAEIIFYDTLLTGEERVFVETYLMDKYAPPVNLGADIFVEYGFCDTTIISENWFKNYYWSTGLMQDTLPELEVTEQGKYSVSVTDLFGRNSSDSINVYYNYPNQLSDTTICLGDTISWNTRLNHDYNFVWSTTEIDSVIKIYQAGDYFVNVTDSFGCIYYSDTITVTIDSLPLLATLGPDTTICGGSLITVENAHEASFVWNTGETTEYITIVTAGQYWVIVTDSLGCVKTDTINYLIQGVAPTPLFTSNVTCVGDSTFFTDISFPNDNSNINSWDWDFGDTYTSTNQHPKHLYQNPGVYTINLEITTDSGCVNIVMDSIQVYKIPYAGFEHTALCANNSIRFVDTSITSDGTIVGWEWDFGDANQSSNQDPGHTYLNSGYYDVEFVAITDFGCRDTFIQQLYIKKSPAASFSFSTICEENKAEFTDLSISDPANPLLSWNWNYNNNFFSADQSPQHTFTDTGYYDILLVVQSVNGCIDSLTKTVFVNANPKAYFIDSIACINNSYEFADSSSILIGNIIYWKWTIDGINAIEEQNPDYTFVNTGYHSIELVVSSDSSCVDTFSLSDFYVQILPDPSFIFTPTYTIPYGEISFTAPYNQYMYDWDFGDGSFSALTDPLHMYLDSGLYNINLIVTDTLGCKDSLEKQITVLIPNCDIVVSSVDYEISDDYMSVSSVIGNYGNIMVTQMELFIHLDNGYQIREVWSGQLYPGTLVNYDFSGTYKVDKNGLPELICVIAKPLEYTDIDETNNEYCLVDQSAFNLLDPYPNPASDKIYYEVILPADGEISVVVYDKKAKKIEDFETSLRKGYNRLMLDIESYSLGTYTLQVKYLQGNHSKQFVVKR